MAERGATVRETVDARKAPIGRAAALALVRKAKRLVVAKGKKIVEVDLAREKPSDAELTALVIGPTGNLRAPTLRLGDRLMIGFHADAYDDVIG